MKKTPNELATAWANNSYFDQDSRAEIQSLIDNNDHKEIEERFYKNLEFGTGGLRSILGAGNNRINKYTVRKATQGMATTIKNTFSDNLKVAISYDSRNFSFEFAKEVACVFAGNGIKAYIYKHLNPVPLLSFAVRHYKAKAGVMITASHNPPEYNGYKAYWDDGAQVIPPYDKQIIEEFNAIKDFADIAYMDFEQGINEKLIEWIGDEVEEKYFKSILTKSINPELCREKGKNITLVYTPIHGSGLVSCQKALLDLGMSNLHIVKEQAEPNGDFPTVSSPNPENPEALKMAVDLLKSIDGDLALASDPDTDRLGIALNINGEIHYLNGNQIGTLKLYYILTNLKERNALPANPYVIKTIVTTPLQEKIAEDFNVAVENTLTGFKWICGKMREIEENEPERNFLFGTEESFGYLSHNFVRDKDGVSSVSLMAEMALWYKEQGLNLLQALDQIYEKYGYSYEHLLCIDYKGKEGAEKISRIMDQFRNSNEKPNLKFSGQEVSLIKDYLSLKSKNLDSNEMEPINLPTSNVLGYYLKNGDRVYLRPSGTEPKIKFYIMVQETDGDLSSKKKIAMKKVEEVLSFIKSEVAKA